jgi:hypothetical protein
MHLCVIANQDFGISIYFKYWYWISSFIDHRNTGKYCRTGFHWSPFQIFTLHAEVKVDNKKYKTTTT